MYGGGADVREVKVVPSCIADTVLDKATALNGLVDDETESTTLQCTRWSTVCSLRQRARTDTLECISVMKSFGQTAAEAGRAMP